MAGLARGSPPSPQGRAAGEAWRVPLAEPGVPGGTAPPASWCPLGLDPQPAAPGVLRAAVLCSSQRVRKTTPVRAFFSCF